MELEFEAVAWDPAEAAKSRLKAFSSLASQGAAIIRSRSMGPGGLGATFGRLPGFWKAWSDGAVPAEGALAGLGGVVADESGSGVAAFSLACLIEGGRKGPMLAELRALERALDLAWEAGARKVEARFDCMPLARAAAAALMGDPAELANPESAQLLAAMERFDCVALRWTPREANRLADALSKRPLGGGLFHGGDSQRPSVDRAWADPEGSPCDGGEEFYGLGAARAELERRRGRATASLEGVCPEGSAKIVLGACWRGRPEGGEWIAAASSADPAAKRGAKLEQCAAWALGTSSEPGLQGLRTALFQALAKKAAAVAAKAGGQVSSFSLIVPRAIGDLLERSGGVDAFLDHARSLADHLAPGASVEAGLAEEGREVSARQAAHLMSGWELGRAVVIQEIQAARESKRRARSKRAPRG